jgi:hypothetical protein
MGDVDLISLINIYLEVVLLGGVVPHRSMSIQADLDELQLCSSTITCLHLHLR